MPLATKQTLKRHMENIHNESTDEDMGTVRTVFDDDLSSSSDNEEGPMDTDESGDEDEADPVWETIVRKIVDNGNADLTDSNGELKNSKIIDAIQTVTENQLQIAHDIRHSKVYKSIEKSAENNQEQDFDEDESWSAAWKQRKHLIIRDIITPYHHIFTGEEEESIKEEPTD